MKYSSTVWKSDWDHKGNLMIAWMVISGNELHTFFSWLMWFLQPDTLSFSSQLSHSLSPPLYTHIHLNEVCIKNSNPAAWGSSHSNAKIKHTQNLYRIINCSMFLMIKHYQKTTLTKNNFFFKFMARWDFHCPVFPAKFGLWLICSSV